MKSSKANQREKRPLLLPMSNLPRYINKIEKVFNIDALIEGSIDWQDVVTYYQNSELGYWLFHSKAGAVHMALNFNGKFDPKGYYEQSNIIAKYIEKHTVQHVLEIASGKGFNTQYLAKRYPMVKFWGIDITPKHIKIATERSKTLSNLTYCLGDFEEIPFRNNYFDLIFEVEGICHAFHMKRAITEVYRILRPRGYFILFDGFRKKPLDSAPEILKKAAYLVERSMAVQKGYYIRDWILMAESVGFQIEEVTDITEAILPNLARFQKLARGYFKYPWLAQALIRIFPVQLLQNAIAGLLMPFTVQAGLQGYYKIVLQKKE